MKRKSGGNKSKNANVDKELFCRAVHQETGIALEHVLAIVHLLLSEMRKEIVNRRSVVIGNFGRFEMIEPKPRRIQNVVSGESEVVSIKPLLKFRIKRALRAFLLRRLRKN
jgi:nucleoid DNA-binding protein